MSEPVTIGRLARAAAVNVETVRYYERVGLIAQPPKPVAGYRRYPATTVQRIRFIKRAQGLGFTLEEIADLLQLGDGDCPDVRQRAERKRDRVQQRIDDLMRLRDTLDQLIAACRNSTAQCACPIVETLSDPDRDPASDSRGVASGSPR